MARSTSKPKRRKAAKVKGDEGDDVPSLFKARVEIAAAKGMLLKLEQVCVLDVQRPLLEAARNYLEAADININGAAIPLEAFIRKILEGEPVA